MTVRLLIAARVESARTLSRRVRGFRLRPLHRDVFPAFRAGDHVQLQHASGIRRDYSLIGSPGDPSAYEVAIQRDPDGRGGSVLFHDELRAGDPVFVSYPQAGIRIDEHAEEHIFIAGGIGVTAIVGLLHELPAGRRGIVHYAARSPEDAVLVDRLEHGRLPVELHVSSRGRRLDVSGVLGRASPTATVYSCGPLGLMAEIDAHTRGWDPGRMRSERFAAPAVRNERLGDEFTAHLIAAGKSVRVGEEESLLRALHRIDVPLEYSCESGVCGTCVLEVVAGEVEHRDLCLDERQRAAGLVATCVSRGRGDIRILI